MDLPNTEKLLALGGNFRLPNAKRVELYRDMMLTGRWIWEMEPVHVSADNTLDQAQHRLLACKEYLEAGGEPQWVEVRYGTPPEWADLLDSAQVRTNAQRVAHAGFAQAGDIASVVLATWQISQEGIIGHMTSPPDLMRQVLGTKTHPRLCSDTIHEGVKLAHRIERCVPKVERGGITIPTLGAVLALMLYEDETAARLFAEQMIASGDFAPRLTAVGAEAAMCVLRNSYHANDADRSRHDRKQRTITLMWLAWRNKSINYNTLKTRLLSPDEGKLRGKTKAQWDAVKDEIQVVALDLLDL